MQDENISRYYASLSALKTMRANGIINDEDFKKVEKYLDNKYGATKSIFINSPCYIPSNE